eukprot:2844748-Rhodomonas_salina.1
MTEAAETPQPFPDFSNANEVLRQYTVADLKVILTDVGLPVTGDKKALVARICEHATIQVALLDEAAAADLSDLQIIYALQHLKIVIPWEVSKRLEALVHAVARPASRRSDDGASATIVEANERLTAL